VVALPVAFGNYNPTSSLSTDATGTITVTCGAIALGANISYEIRLSKGNSTSFSPRQLKNGSNALSYNLYTNTARSLIWGDTTGGTVSVSDGYILAIISNAINYTVYGRIPASQNVAAGLYSDTIVVSVIY
jgi:spore coat protein U-like protein